VTRSWLQFETMVQAFIGSRQSRLSKRGRPNVSSTPPVAAAISIAWSGIGMGLLVRRAARCVSAAHTLLRPATKRSAW
jgi:hypothetical protein